MSDGRQSGEGREQDRVEERERGRGRKRGGERIRNGARIMETTTQYTCMRWQGSRMPPPPQMTIPVSMVSATTVAERRQPVPMVRSWRGQ